MKQKFYIMAVIAGVAVVSGLNANATPISINYASTIANHIGAKINFDGAGNFSFSSDYVGHYFQVTSGTAGGDYGTLSGIYAIGTVTTAGSTQSANVTGTGTLTINDGANVLSGTLSWINIVQTGTGGNLNLSGQVNLTGVTYSGSDSDLLTLVGDDSNVLSFSFNPAKSLTDLVGSANSTSFSGVISEVPDGGMTVMLLGAALSAMGLLRKKLTA